MASKSLTPDHPDFDDNPEWTAADFAKARSASKVLPAGLYQSLTRGRGPATNPTKKPVSIRLSARVLDHNRAQGAGWRTRLNSDLEALIGEG